MPFMPGPQTCPERPLSSPDRGGIMPCVLYRGGAQKAMGDWLGHLWFAPNGLKDYARKGGGMQGIHVPCRTFNADIKSCYRGEHGVVCTYRGQT